MPVLMKKYSDCVDVLDQLEEWTEHIYKESGMCKNQPDQPPAFPPLVQVPTWPDQPRSHIPPEASDFDPLQEIKVPCFFYLFKNFAFYITFTILNKGHNRQGIRNSRSQLQRARI